MRTPWKFLSDLVSRKASEDRAVERITEAPNVLAVEHHRARDEKDADAVVVGQPSGEVEAHLPVPEAEPDEAFPAAGPTSEAEIDDAAATTPPAATEVATGSASSTSAAPVSDADEDEQSRPATSAKQAKNSRRSAVVEPVAPDLEPASPPAVIIKKTADEEMIALDEEIAELRRLLAKKLLLQNAYLKSMLDRYTAGT